MTKVSKQCLSSEFMLYAAYMHSLVCIALLIHIHCFLTSRTVFSALCLVFPDWKSPDEDKQLCLPEGLDGTHRGKMKAAEKYNSLIFLKADG